MIGYSARHRITGEYGFVLSSGVSPAGVPNFAVRTNAGISWWYATDTIRNSEG